jgi:site-specific DNA-adenine methylase
MDKTAAIPLTTVLVDIRTNRHCAVFHSSSEECKECKQCQSLQAQALIKEKIFLETLEKKNANNFVYAKPDYTRDKLENSFEIFQLASTYSFDDNTLDWLVGTMANCDYRSKSIIEMLVEAGIVDCSNGDKYNVGSWMLYNQFSSSSDEDISWYIFILNLTVTPYAYREYG